jgi:hypothetical protein
VVKHFLQRESKDCLCPPQAMRCICGHKAGLKIITKRIVTPSYAEVELNPRCRSARLRVAERVITPSEQYEKAVEQLNCAIGFGTQGLRRPALIEKIKRTFLSLQKFK